MDKSGNKTELRQYVRGQLAGLSAEEMALFDTQIASSFFTSQKFMPQSSIACYMPLKGEVSCRSILQTLGNQGHVICLPVVTGRQDALTFRQYKTGDTLERGKLGPLEPLPGAREIIPDVLIIPMMGFNKQKFRLGYGTGFYDRTLTAFRQIKPIRTIGLAYGVQEISDLEVEPHDMPLDVVITEKEIIT